MEYMKNTNTNTTTDTNTTTENIFIYTIGSDESKMSYLKLTSEYSKANIHFVKKNTWAGYVDKILTMKEILSQHKDTDIVCFIDAYDVLCFSDKEEILHKFKDYNCNVLLSSELNCYPPKLQSDYDYLEYMIQESREPTDAPVFSTHYKYVNSGGYIGYCHGLMKMLQWKSVEEIIDICEDGGDQTYISMYYLQNAMDESLKIKIDHQQTIFQSMYRVDFREFNFKNGRLCNTVLQTKPCFAHFNGFVLYGNMIISLDTEMKENVYDVFISKFMKSIATANEIFELNYRVLFFLFYDGKYQFYIPQLPTIRN